MNSKNVRPLSELPKQKIKGLCFDIDDTFSSHGKITAQAFQSLWSLKEKGFILIPVTGRPAGWCDHIARFWPVDAVVGENGAFFMCMKNGKLHREETLDISLAQDARSKLKDLAILIQKEFPNTTFASDQDYRNYDLAIDFCEDVDPWDESEIQRLVKFCESQGAIAKVSSIHVNTWFGRYSKVEGIQHFLNRAPQLGFQFPSFQSFAFAGDSPNDQPLFQAFENSIGVRNVERFLSSLTHPPKFITEKECGEGFSQICEFLRS